MHAPERIGTITLSEQPASGYALVNGRARMGNCMFRARHTWQIFAALACLATGGCTLRQAEPVPRSTAPLALVHATIIDPRNGAERRDTTILIADGRITEIRPTDGAPPPAGARVIDATGKYVVPGLIDAHVHLTDGRQTDDIITRRLEAALAAGITSVRDMGGDGIILQNLARRSQTPSTATPRVFFSATLAGPTWFTDPRAVASAHGAPPGEQPWLRAVTEQTDLPAVIAAARSFGVSGLKIYADVEPALLARIVAEAHRQGLQVWSHATIVPSRPSDAIDAGVDSLSHAVQLQFEFAPTLPATIEDLDLAALRAAVRHSPAEQERLLRRMARSGVVLDATLMQSRNDPSAAADLLVRQARMAGVPVAAGTDAMNGPGGRPNLFVELETLVTRAGFSPIQALEAATWNGARALGQERRLGLVERGYLADLLVLRGDPREDIRNLEAIDLVIKSGVVHRESPSPTLSNEAVTCPDCVGSYQVEGGPLITVALVNGRLSAQAGDLPPIDLVPEGALTFRGVAPGSPRIVFDRALSGTIESLTLTTGATARTARKVQR